MIKNNNIATIVIQAGIFLKRTHIEGPFHEKWATCGHGVKIKLKI